MIDSISKVLDELETQSILEKSKKTEIPPDDRMLAITKETGELLNMILRLKNAKNMLEIGMSTGYSTIWCAESISEQSGKIITIEQNPSKIKRAKENFQKAGVTNTITIMEGLAMQILTELSLKQKYEKFFDFVLIDADKENVKEEDLNVLFVSLHSDSKLLTIVGTSIVPEFGPMVFAILGISVVSMIVLSQRFKPQISF